MSYVNIVLTPNFISVISDGQVTGENDEVIQNDFPKFLVTSGNVIVAFTGDKNIADKMLEMLAGLGDLSFSQLSTAIENFIDDVSYSDNRLIKFNIIIAAMIENKSIAIGIRKIGDIKQITTKESPAVMNMNPEDVGMDTVAAFTEFPLTKNGKFDKNLVRNRQIAVLRMVAKNSKLVNEKHFQRFIQ